MKNILKFSFVALISFLLFSCTKNEDLAMLTTTTPGSLTSSKSAIVLTKETAATNAVTFKWTNPNAGTSVAYTNQLQFAVKGTNFANPKTVDLDKGVNTVSYNVQDFNAVMLNLGLPLDGTKTDVEARIKSTVYSLDGSATSLPAPTFSPAINLTVTPYALISYLYAVGAFQGWNIGAAQPLVSATSNGVYVGYLKFTDANSEFLVVPVLGSYDNKFGSNDNVHLIKNGGDNLKAVNAGYQKITVDTNLLTFGLAPYAMGIAGSGTPGGWDENAADIPMAYNFTTQKWTATATFNAGEIKFRTNRKWTENYGGSNGTISGDNIAVTAGLHTVTLDLVNQKYTVN
ncbi:SusE domain-containing protein [Halpernia frigidisoli]|uniref:SusE outer membrane protein n=1 Tax=Halpernia frigidisoli TaxID=1125876 RepID=A0A1I3DRF7_9FLAO|nr:SusE domain-containing protein [Halpernia frigidisoli]SFH89243.1 SusE outer membrane protein [Halpernia frigidisoli]